MRSAVKVTLRKIDRSNWQEAFALRTRPGQERFVATPIMSVALATIRQHGDHYVHTPMGIYDGTQIVGYVTTLCDPQSADDYWIDDILIDARYQGRGYGRAAMTAAIRFMLASWPRCAQIRLSHHPENRVAARLYPSMGFRTTGRLVGSGQPEYHLSGEALEAFR
jgi:diamine N-acetyltransferase